MYKMMDTQKKYQCKIA